jgi:hypothetical protein
VVAALDQHPPADGTTYRVRRPLSGAEITSIRAAINVVAREATDVIAAASRHCDKLAAQFGEDSRAYLDAATSW